MATPEILDLNTLAPERPLARIRSEAKPDGDLYELLVPDDLGTADLATLSRLFSDHDQLWEKADRDAAEDSRLDSLLDKLAGRLIIDAPPEAIASLSALAKRTVAVRFFVSAGLVAAPILGKDLESRLTSNSLASPASTEEESASGS